MDPNWFNFLGQYPSVNPGVPVLFPMEAIVANRTPGFYETEFELRVDNTRQPIRANFEIYGQPGSLSIHSDANGRVEAFPARASYSNGDRVLLTAVPDRYYRFTGWTGSVNATINPLEVRVNGPLTIRAQFAFTGEANCSPLIAALRVEAPPEGDVGRLEVTATPACTWSASDLPSWLRITGQHPGPGSATTLSYLVDPLPGTAGRSALIRIGASTVAVRQSPPSLPQCPAFPLAPAVRASDHHPCAHHRGRRKLSGRRTLCQFLDTRLAVFREEFHPRRQPPQLSAHYVPLPGRLPAPHPPTRP